MMPATIIRAAQADGVMLVLSPAGTLKAVGDSAAVSRWLPVLRANKSGILKLLSEQAPSLQAIDGEDFEERAGIREYDGGFDRSDAELLAAWETTQALFQRLTAREYLARYAPDRLPAGDSTADFPIAQMPPGNDFWLERQRRGGGQ